MKRSGRLFLMVLALALVGVIALPGIALAAPTGTRAMYRLYNPWNGDHLFTLDTSERDGLLKHGWDVEGPAWYAPNSGSSVWRAYNPYTGEHLYTTDNAEYRFLTNIGWRGEGQSCCSSKGGTPIYRLYNHWLTAGTHLFTTNKAEYDRLVSVGWEGEGIVFYGSNATQTAAQANADYTVYYDGITFVMPEYWRGKVSYYDTGSYLDFYPGGDYPFLLQLDGDISGSGWNEYTRRSAETLSLSDGSLAYITPWDDYGTLVTVISSSGRTYLLVTQDAYNSLAQFGDDPNLRPRAYYYYNEDLQTLGQGTGGKALGTACFEKLLPYMSFA